MKENIEEDIKVAEKLIKTMEQDRITFKDEQSKEIYDYFIKALQNILSNYKKLQEDFKQVDHECFRLEQKELMLEKEVELAKEALKKQCDIADERNQLLTENQQLQKENEELKRLLNGNLYEDYKHYKNLAGEYQGSCVSKQKIKDKIEELEDKIQELSDEQGYWGDNELLVKMEVLQDLLEKKGE